jgi:predicted enzyme related to lactoylglutathione lyase
MSQVAHFAINASDVSRAKRFYEKVFGWKFEAYGPPDFFMVMEASATAHVSLRGSLQKRRELVPGVAMTGFECTISVDDIQRAKAAIEANGGKIVMQICTLAGIGRLLFFQDPEGNLAGAMQYDPKAD